MDPNAVMSLVEQDMELTTPRFDRLKAMAKLKKVSIALGPEAARSRLLPLLTSKIPDEEDEVLLEIAMQLGTMQEAVGGPAHSFLLLTPLELICNSEETVVRDQASKSFAATVKLMDWAVGGEACMDVVRRLAQADWFTNKIAVAGTLSAVYSQCGDEALRTEVLDIMRGLLAPEETPMVKRAAVLNLVDLAEAVAQGHGGEELIESELLVLAANVARREITDSVKVNATQALIGVIDAWCSIAAPQSNPFASAVRDLTAAATSHSWRVRHIFAKSYGRVARALVKHAATDAAEFLTNAESPLVYFLKDPETEVRLAAVKALPEVSAACAAAGGGACLVPAVFPLFEELVSDTELNVRIEMAKAMLAMVPQPNMPLEGMNDTLVVLVQDQEKDVQITVLAALDKALSSEELDVQIFAPETGPFSGMLEIVAALAANDDWRIRRAVVSLSASLARTMGAEYYKTNLLPHLINALEDYITDVRLGAVATLPALIKTLGHEWLKQEVLDTVLGMWEGIREPNAMSPALGRSSYLLKITVINALGAMGSDDLPDDTAERLLTLLNKCAREDRTPNVRFNAVNALAALHPFVSGERQSAIRNTLTTVQASDTDADCKYYAQQGLAALAS